MMFQFGIKHLEKLVHLVAEKYSHTSLLKRTEKTDTKRTEPSVKLNNRGV